LQIDYENNKKASGLSIEQITKYLLHGTSIPRSVFKDYMRSIRNAMGRVHELAAENGFTIFPVRISKNEKTPDKKKIIICYKILDTTIEGHGGEFLDDLRYKEKLADGFVKSYEKQLNVAKENGILSNKDEHQLVE